MSKDILCLISIGELADRISILDIKRKCITDPAKLVNINKEYNLLLEREELALTDITPEERGKYAFLSERLTWVNTDLWNVEEKLREFEKNQIYLANIRLFAEKAREVYKLNDQRALLKREINTLFGSELVEEKSYV